MTDLSRNYNHPKSGDTIKVEPIRTPQAISKIKTLLLKQPRNYCLFVLGINTVFRASELLSIRIDHVTHLLLGDILEIKQQKTKQYRSVTFNQAAYDAVQIWLKARESEALKKKDLSLMDDDAYFFTGLRGSNSLKVPTLNNLVKDWCTQVNLKGNYGSHTLRKTRVFMQRTKQDTPLPLLMQALGHATQRQTMAYLCIQEKEIENVYTSLEL